MPLLAIVFIALGFIFVFIEVFLIPGFGPVGVIGGLLMAVGVAVAGYTQGVQTAVVYAAVTILLLLPICAIGFWLMPRTKLGKSFIHSTSEYSESGYRSSSDELPKFIGKTGTTLTPLRPAGIIEVEGVRLDVLTRGEFIEKGKEVKIIDIEGSRIVVGV